MVKEVEEEEYGTASMGEAGYEPCLRTTDIHEIFFLCEVQLDAVTAQIAQ